MKFNLYAFPEKSIMKKTAFHLINQDPISVIPWIRCNIRSFFLWTDVVVAWEFVIIVNRVEGFRTFVYIHISKLSLNTLPIINQSTRLTRTNRVSTTFTELCEIN